MPDASVSELDAALAFGDNELIALVLSEARSSGGEYGVKVQARPVEIKGDTRIQFETHWPDKKATHQNVPVGDAGNHVRALLSDGFRQAYLYTTRADVHITHDKKNRVHVRTLPPTRAKNADLLSHNRRKNYVLPENAPVPFLVRLGVMTQTGTVVAAKYDKFRQINRFLEMVADVVPSLPPEGPLYIVDFGCGKSYLTFALYHFLQNVLRREVHIVGLDLKSDVVQHCNTIAQDLGISDRLRFLVGEIGGVALDLPRVHMVVSLHACDTATDDALVQATLWNAPVILSVPCCQHELMPKIENAALRPLLKHGILKERTAALVTDALRAHVLELAGYNVQVLEFIDMEHTPKNLLLRAVRASHAPRLGLADGYRAFCALWSLDRPYLEQAWEAAHGKPLL